ncbi:hypothetical protein QJS10_CPB18g00739 [Acorus calamus]|uniref:RNase H type-1 domain-containing protein n=1 Tax=Acorus calamus TaxID=4465 RepID=A0AAV9CJQ2_ACOCL|nr:hypothetical protein QJS10_CPB18g00739 [Acorus calamus]
MARVSLASINHLELLGVKSGALTLCSHLHFSKVIFESDSTTVACWLQGRGSIPWTSMSDYLENLDILDGFEEWSIYHTYRVANAPADLLPVKQLTMGSRIISVQDVWNELEVALMQVRQVYGSDGEIETFFIREQRSAQKAVFVCEGVKALGPDGFGPRFFQAFWDIVKDDIVQMFEEFQAGQQSIGSVNSSPFVLILKKEGPEQIGVYRMICSINGYMTIPKVLANSMKRVCPFIIEPHQSAFIQGYNLQEGTNDKFDNSTIWTVNVERGRAEELAARLGCELSKASQCHLGLPLVKSRLLQRGLQPMIERIYRAKASWLAEQRPLGGWKIYTTTVSYLKSSYVLFIHFFISKGILHKIDSIRRWFFWNGPKGGYA